MYLLTQFDGVTLPIGQPAYTAGTAPSMARMVRTAGGGVFDAAGTEQAKPALPYELVYDCKALADTDAGLRSTLDALRAKRGVRGKLWRQGQDDGALQWATARLMAVQYQMAIGFKLVQPLSMRWSVQSLWHGERHGAPWTFDSGLYFDDGLSFDMAEEYELTTTPITLTVNNGGNTFTDDVILTLTVGTGDITGLRVQVGSCDLLFSGTVAATKQLVIDCSPSRLSVLNDGAAAWADLTLGGGHASEAWLQLQPGANSVVVTRTGGGPYATLAFDFSERWE